MQTFQLYIDNVPISLQNQHRCSWLSRSCRCLLQDLPLSGIITLTTALAVSQAFAAYCKPQLKMPVSPSHTFKITHLFVPGWAVIGWLRNKITVLAAVQLNVADLHKAACYTPSMSFLKLEWKLVTVESSHLKVRKTFQPQRAAVTAQSHTHFKNYN